MPVEGCGEVARRNLKEPELGSHRDKSEATLWMDGRQMDATGNAGYIHVTSTRSGSWSVQTGEDLQTGTACCNDGVEEGSERQERRDQKETTTTVAMVTFTLSSRSLLIGGKGLRSEEKEEKKKKKKGEKKLRHAVFPCGPPPQY